MMQNLAELKKNARLAGLAQRKLAHQSGAGADLAAAGHLLKWVKAGTYPIISGYMPIQTEINIIPAMRLLFDQGHKICVPVIIGAGRPLEFHQWTPDSTMIKGAFGAMIPQSGDILLPDLIICPLVSFDTSGNRMGYGGGFYDRSIAELAPVTAIGFAYAGQQSKPLPTEETDRPLQAIITENGVISPDQSRA